MLNNQLLGSEKDFMESKDRELKDREKKLKERQKNYFISQLLCLKMIWISLKNKK